MIESLSGSGGEMEGATLKMWEESILQGMGSDDSIRSSGWNALAESLPVPSARSIGDSGDFEIREKLGAGGMGVVYSAHQTSMNREVALKMVKPERSESQTAAESLMSEAVVTGCLDHPNVVPVYDLGVDGDGRMFYAMKEVEGFPWSELIGEKSLDENLDILLRVADTIAFAHSRDILHRDLKPQNIMLGAFGEIMVMDWGAACTLSGSNVAGIVPADTAYCGTPAYMAPEMAKADKNRMGIASDIYLLGAILYQILTGRPPRSEKNPLYCIVAAAHNRIDPVEEDGELLRIALRAMATAPVDRHASVEEFQHAIRDYRSHSESLSLLNRARVSLSSAKASFDYDSFNQAIYGLREALTLWPENPDAQPLLESTVLDYVRCAMGRHDYELAQSLLDKANPAHSELWNQIRIAVRERDSRKNRLRRVLLTARLLLVAMAILFGIGFFMVRTQQKETERQRNIAESQRREADIQREEALEQKREAEIQRERASNEHRQSLVNLISAHYGEQNYEATINSFWRLHDEYGMDGLDEETLLNVRVAAAMNPYRGSVKTSVADPLGIVQATETNCVWVVGHREMKKVYLTPNAGYDPETLVPIHDFNFGKRNASGKVVETVEFPNPLKTHSAVHESKEGGLWVGSGSVVYRQANDGWLPVVDILSLEFPMLSPGYDIGEKVRNQSQEWLEASGKQLPITGILLDSECRHVAVVLGGGVLCWIDLFHKQCIGWYYVDFETHWDSAEIQGAPLLAFSEDEEWLLFREGVKQSILFGFHLPDFLRKGFFYGRNYPIPDICFPDDRRCWALLEYENTVFSPARGALAKPIPGLSSCNHGEWCPEKFSMGHLPVDSWKVASLSKDGCRCVVITKDDVLFSGSTVEGYGLDLSRKIVRRDWVDVKALSRSAVSLDTEGRLISYDIQTWASGNIALGGKVVYLCSGFQPDQLFVIVERGYGRNDVVEISEIRSAFPHFRTVLKGVEGARICCDPSGRWIVVNGIKGWKIYDLVSGENIFTATNTYDTVFPVRFNAKGDYLIWGGDWSYFASIYRVSDWKQVLWDERGSHQDIFFREDEDRRYVVMAQGKTLSCVKLDDNNMNFVSNAVWSVGTGGSSLSLIPYTDPLSICDLFWCRTWGDRFTRIDAKADKSSSLPFMHWAGRGLKTSVYNQNGTKVLLPRLNGECEVVMKSDLYPLFDSRCLTEKVDAAVLNSDASLAGFLCSGDLVLLNLAKHDDDDDEAEVERRASIHYVSKDGLNQWPYTSWLTAANSIRGALKVADGGATVVLDDGTFLLDRELDVHGSVSLKSRNGPASTVIDGGGRTGLFRLHTCEHERVVEGITFSRGASQRSGGGFLLEGSQSVMFSNCVFSANRALGGGAIGCFSNETDPHFWVRIHNCAFMDNVAQKWGGGAVHAGLEKSFCDLDIVNCHFTNNLAEQQGGAIHCKADVAEVKVVGCSFFGNVSDNIGGGLAVTINDGSAIVRDSRFAGNLSAKGAAAVSAFPRAGSCFVSNCTFSNNLSGGANKSVLENFQGIAITNCTFLGNE
ncbi:protein kinase [Pontiellaceae bacterium B12227]|nr:protein kinase [Pontiellaceae bacterium B12227]